MSVRLAWLGGGAFLLSNDERRILLGGTPEGVSCDVAVVDDGRGPGAEAAGFVVDGPGEYEVGGVFVIGVATEHDGATTTLYAVEMSDVAVAHVGGAATLPSDAEREAIGAADVLLARVDGPPGLSPEQAVEMVGLLESALVVPIYDPGSEKSRQALSQFLQEMAADKDETPLRALDISPLRLPSEPQVRVLEPIAASDA